MGLRMIKGKHWLLIGIITGAGYTAVFAEDAQVAGQTVEVLDSQEYDLGERSIIYHRIKPPVLKNPEPTAAIEPASLPPSAGLLQQAALTSQSSSSSVPPELLQRVQKETFSPFIDIRVVNGVSEIRWRDELGDYIVWSSIDARVFRVQPSFETEDLYFMIFGSIADETIAEINEWNALIDDHSGPQEEKRSIPTLGPVSEAFAQYAVIQEPANAATGYVQRVMDALHAYYDNHRITLHQRLNELIAVIEERERQLRENPPQPQDTVIHFFPIQSNAKLEDVQ